MPSNATCSIEGCEKRFFARGWCHMHYIRWWKHGIDGLLVEWKKPTIPVLDRFWAKVDKDGPVPEHAPELGPCWIWTAGGTGRGYGAFYPDPQHQTSAHRFAYELLVGPIEDGMTLDHLCHTNDPTCSGGNTCRHRRCCNPAHLEQVTIGENVLRGVGYSAQNARKTHCPRGHPYDLTSSGRRRCLRCKRERYHERKRTA